MRSKLFRILSVVTTAAMLASMLTIAPALAMSQPNVTLIAQGAGIAYWISSTNVYNITFTAGAAVPAAGIINIVFPPTTSLNNFIQATIISTGGAYNIPATATKGYVSVTSNLPTDVATFSSPGAWVLYPGSNGAYNNVTGEVTFTAAGQTVLIYAGGGTSGTWTRTIGTPSAYITITKSTDCVIEVLAGIGGGPIAAGTQAGYSVSGTYPAAQTLTIRVPPGGIGAGSLVGATIGATSGVVNPATAGNYMLTVETRDASNVLIEAAMVSASYSIIDGTIQPGDANGDGIINVLDMTKIARIILGIASETIGADANIDGDVNLLDMALVAKMIIFGVPFYGGTAHIAGSSDLTTFDEAFGSQSSIVSLKLTNEEMLTGDWTKGPAGTNEADFILAGINKMSLKTGCLAESYEIPEIGTMVFHIREGVHWHFKPPTNGRELTVDDVVFTFQRMCTAPGSYIKMTYPNLCSTIVITGDEAARTVTLQCPVSEWGNMYTIFPDYVTIMPRDAIEYFGDMNDWHNSIGTGPFILTDYISNGSATFVRNPNYWGQDPIGPGMGNQLPYMDGIKMYIISNYATQLAAMRTGQIDGMSGTYDDMEEFLTNPNIKNQMYTSDSSYVISMRTDKADSPFSKKEVRQALMLATDFNQIKNEYYGGKAEILDWPICYTEEYANAYVPMENLPANVQELYSHNVTKAQELLTTAGYPTGFSASVVTYDTPSQIDYLSLIQDMWADIGVTLTIDAMDLTTYVARVRARNYDDMMYFYSSTNWQKMQNFTGNSIYNMSYVNDAICNTAAAQALTLIGIDEDEAQLEALHASLMPYVLEQAWVIPKPNAYTYLVWWPWVKNWHGELNVGYYNSPSYLKYRIMDMALKKAMGY